MPPKKKFNRIDVLDFVAAPVGNWADDDSSLKPMDQSSWAPAPAVGTLDILNATRASIPLPTSPPYTARVSNLTFEMTETELRKYLTDQGLSIKSLRCPKDAATGRSRGSAFVEFDTQKDLATAVKLDGQSIHNRPIRVSVAESRMHDNRYESNADWSAPRRGPLDPTERMGGSRFGGADAGPLNWGSRREPSGAEQAPRAPRAGLDRFYIKEGDQGNFGGSDRFGGPARGPRQFEDRAAPSLNWGARRTPGPLEGGEERSFRRENRAPREHREPREPKEPLPNLDWSARREVKPLAPRPAPREPRAPVSLDWTSGRALEPKTVPSSDAKSRNAAPAPAPGANSNAKAAPKGHGFEVLSDA